MGISSSSQKPSGKKVLESKMEFALKTGVLNMEEMSLKPQSSVWSKLQDDSMVTKLKSIDISGNDIKFLPNEIIGLTELKTIHASKCSIQRLANLSSLVKLTTLTLNNNDLECDVVELLPASLKNLDLSCNHFTSFATCLQNLINLTELNLSSNRLSSIIGIGALISIVELILDDNLLTELPDDMSNMVKLKHISCKRNKLQKISPTTTLQSIPSTIFINTQIERLDLDGNAGLRKAEVLDMGGITHCLDRRLLTKDKNLKGGAIVDHSLFGLD